MKKLTVVFLLFFFQAFAQDARFYVRKGNEHFLTLEFELAEANYRQALDIEPRNAEARYNLGNALMQQKKYNAAIEAYDAVTANDENLQAASHYNSGVSYSKLRNWLPAIDGYKKALRINPADTEARENLQKALSELQKQNQQQNRNNSGGGGGGMSQNQADEMLKDLSEKERELQKKIQGGQNQGGGSGKDW